MLLIAPFGRSAAIKSFYMYTTAKATTIAVTTDYKVKLHDTTFYGGSKLFELGRGGYNDPFPGKFASFEKLGWKNRR